MTTATTWVIMILLTILVGMTGVAVALSGMNLMESARRTGAPPPLAILVVGTASPDRHPDPSPKTAVDGRVLQPPRPAHPHETGPSQMIGTEAGRSWSVTTRKTVNSLMYSYEAGVRRILEGRSPSPLAGADPQ
jgi:hypothetical protein